MGTYSDVMFAMNVKDYRMIQVLKKTPLPRTILELADIKGVVKDDRIYWKWVDIKWYGSVKDINSLDCFMDYLEINNKEYGFIEVCENESDPDIKGEPYIFDMYTSIELHHPDLEYYENDRKRNDT